MTERIKLTDEDLHIIFGSSNGLYDYKLQFRSLEGLELQWTKEQTAQLKAQILEDQEFVTELGDGWKDIIKFVRETKKENKHLRKLNKDLANAISLEVDSNYKLHNIKQELEEKLEKIEEFRRKILNSNIDDLEFINVPKELQEILKDDDPVLDLAKKKRID